MSSNPSFVSLLSILLIQDASVAFAPASHHTNRIRLRSGVLAPSRHAGQDDRCDASGFYLCMSWCLLVLSKPFRPFVCWCTHHKEWSQTTFFMCLVYVEVTVVYCISVAAVAPCWWICTGLLGSDLPQLLFLTILTLDNYLFLSTGDTVLVRRNSRNWIRHPFENPEVFLGCSIFLQ
jgi:hypothetical protein